MSSNSSQQPIQISEFQMINHVLVRAGYRGTAAEVDNSATSEAARFLLEQFQQGLRSEDDLAAALESRGRSQVPGDDTPTQVKDQGLDRWGNEGGN